MKENYISPKIEVIRLDSLMEPICISGQDYVKESGHFDADSD